MQEFLTNNTVNCNLMSLTGYRTLVILSALMECSKSNDEINACLFNNQYIKEKFSSDTLRIYINSLRSIGCEITRANKSNSKKYELLSHPFVYNIEKSQLQALTKLYKNLYEKVDIKDVTILENFFNKISGFVKDENTKDILQNVSVLKYIDKNILNNLLLHCKNKNQITFLYNSPKSGEKEIKIVADKLSFKSEKLYLWGTSLTHKQYSYFAADRILNIISIDILKEHERSEPIKVVYELYNQNENYTPESDEKIIEQTRNKFVIEVTSENEFALIQRILYKANDCRIKFPESFKVKILNKLKNMEEIYENL